MRAEGFCVRPTAGLLICQVSGSVGDACAAISRQAGLTKLLIHTFAAPRCALQCGYSRACCAFPSSTCRACCLCKHYLWHDSSRHGMSIGSLFTYESMPERCMLTPLCHLLVAPRHTLLYSRR